MLRMSGKMMNFADMKKKTNEQYRATNEAFMNEMAGKEGVKSLTGGVFYEVLTAGEGTKNPTPRSVVTCFYRGSLIDGKVFDDNMTMDCPAAFRVNELIEGFQIALCAMHVGDHWRVYIPWQKAYGSRSIPDIPGCSTLIFEIRLTGIA